MNLGFSNVISTVNKSVDCSVYTLINTELNLSISAEAFLDTCKTVDNWCIAIDNAGALISVYKKFNSKVSSEVLQSLVGEQSLGYSIEGFVREAWHKCVEFIKKLWQKFKEFMAWLWSKVTQLFAPTKARSAAAIAFAKRHPGLDKFIDTSRIAGESYTSFEADSPMEINSSIVGKISESPAVLKDICLAASSVPLTQEAQSTITIASENGISSYIVGLSQGFSLITREFKSLLKSILEVVSNNSITDYWVRHEFPEMSERYDNTIGNIVHKLFSVLPNSNDIGKLAQYHDKSLSIDGGASGAHYVNDGGDYNGKGGFYGYLAQPLAHITDYITLSHPKTCGDIGYALRTYMNCVESIEARTEKMDEVVMDFTKCMNELDHHLQNVQEEMVDWRYGQKNGVAIQIRELDGTWDAISNYSRKFTTFSRAIMNGMVKLSTWCTQQITSITSKVDMILDN